MKSGGPKSFQLKVQWPKGCPVSWCLKQTNTLKMCIEKIPPGLQRGALLRGSDFAALQISTRANRSRLCGTKRNAERLNRQEADNSCFFMRVEKDCRTLPHTPHCLDEHFSRAGGRVVDPPAQLICINQVTTNIVGYYTKKCFNNAFLLL